MAKTKPERTTYNTGIYASMTDERVGEFRRYQTQFNRETYRMFVLRLRYQEDKDLIEYLESQKETPGNYVLNLIIQDMQKQGLEV